MDLDEHSQQTASSYEGLSDLNFDFDADDIQLNQMLDLNSGIHQSWNTEDMSSWGVPLLDL